MTTKTTKIGLLAALLLFAGMQSLYSQTFEEFARQRQDGFDRFKKEYDQFIAQMENRYDEYVQQRDKEFIEFLNQRWEEYQMFSGKKQETRPKPEEAPVFTPQFEPPVPKPVLVVAPPPPVTPPPRLAPLLPTIQKTEPAHFPTRKAEFIFYNNKVTLNYDPALVVAVPANINNNAFSNFWGNASKAHYNHFIHQLNAYRSDMNLNDWGFYLLVKNAAQVLYPQSENGAVLMSWFLMNHSGYKARAAYYNNRAMLMLASANNIYEVSFQVFNGIRYYLVNGNADKLYTYDKDFPDAVRTIDMNINSPINLGEATETRQISFTYGGVTHNLNFEYSRNLVAFYNDYPLTDIGVYFNSAVSPVAKESLAHQLLPIIGGKSEWDAVSFLLNMVQTEFEYKIDQEQFGREKFFFAEEVLHYPYSDCEDRSVFFAFIVRELLEMKVIGLEYSDHIATAVKFSNDTGGDFFIHLGERFIMADPTFINAPLGLTMPQYANVAANIVDIENIQYAGSFSDRIWETIFAAGGHRAGIRQDIAFDAQGNAFVVGYFKGNMKLGPYQMAATENNNGAFIAKFNSKG
ncbi:MAG TPA: hypothetical protein VLH16_01025, partial [Bacteroidales bacterium]|nr:hypothetical protein [Bacteroidales bacterium]